CAGGAYANLDYW
nr:immunoglobulin heavy chain junction region [Macaca mulatta]MOX58760.1 immunoglobulin heavy chain junction region [Macaca mulatta]MOX59787.1 immunoglobulin heavy chain junction region [Macaca mulatta]MOX60336.1 immunoglobulin heavy chain junction region [Macaca mulatta]MOX60709.1 immunoglobulin heavy chain junction region [Macaca mulatta]